MNRFRSLAPAGLLFATLALVPACESTPESSSTMPSTMPATAPSTMPTTAAMGALNDKCPISDRPVDPDAPHASFAGYQIGFCCGGCVGRWDAMSDSDRRAYVTGLRSSRDPYTAAMKKARAISTVLLVAAVVASVSAATGCQRSLFAGGNSRTQFETYERIRQRSVDPVEPDVFGNPRPALRERLSRR